VVSEQNELELVQATPEELWRLNRFYKRNGHKGKAREQDSCFWLQEGEQIVAALRLTVEDDFCLMRGLWVDQHRQRQGLGSELIQRSRPYWPDKPCYCFPYAHLQGFYSRLGFSQDTEQRSPQKLRNRLSGYLKRGETLLLMGISQDSCH